MLDKTTEGEHVFVRRSALQVPTWSGARVSGVVAATTDSLVLPEGATLIEISALVNIYINFGSNAAITAAVETEVDGSRLFMLGVRAVVVPTDNDGVPYTHLAFIEAVANGDSVIQVEQLAPVRAALGDFWQTEENSTPWLAEDGTNWLLEEAA
jgi:hypothetical protein